MIDIDNASLTQIITGIGGLGLASFALVDAWKSKAGGGISNEGFDAIEAAVRLSEPEAQPKEANVSGLADALLQTLKKRLALRHLVRPAGCVMLKTHGRCIHQVDELVEPHQIDRPRHPVQRLHRQTELLQQKVRQKLRPSC